MDRNEYKKGIERRYPEMKEFKELRLDWRDSYTEYKRNLFKVLFKRGVPKINALLIINCIMPEKPTVEEERSYEE